MHYGNIDDTSTYPILEQLMCVYVRLARSRRHWCPRPLIVAAAVFRSQGKTWPVNTPSKSPAATPGLWLTTLIHTEDFLPVSTTLAVMTTRVARTTVRGTSISDDDSETLKSYSKIIDDQMLIQICCFFVDMCVLNKRLIVYEFMIRYVLCSHFIQS